MTVTLQPGQVPSDEELEAEAAALEEETQGKYERAKKDELSLASLQKMSTEELAKYAKDADIRDYTSLPKQKLVFEVLRARARKQGLMMKRLCGRASHRMRNGDHATLAYLARNHGSGENPEKIYLRR